MIREPNVKKEKRESSDSEAEPGNSCIYVIKQVSQELKTRVLTEPKWVFLFFSIPSMYLVFYFGTTYSMLWIHSFIKTGEIDDERDAETLYTRFSLMSIPFVLVGMVLSGLISDRV